MRDIISFEDFVNNKEMTLYELKKKYDESTKTRKLFSKFIDRFIELSDDTKEGIVSAIATLSAEIFKGKGEDPLACMLRDDYEDACALVDFYSFFWSRFNNDEELMDIMTFTFGLYEPPILSIPDYIINVFDIIHHQEKYDSLEKEFPVIYNNLEKIREYLKNYPVAESIYHTWYLSSHGEVITTDNVFPKENVFDTDVFPPALVNTEGDVIPAKGDYPIEADDFRKASLWSAFLSGGYVVRMNMNKEGSSYLIFSLESIDENNKPCFVPVSDKTTIQSVISTILDYEGNNNFIENAFCYGDYICPEL